MRVPVVKTARSMESRLKYSICFLLVVVLYQYYVNTWLHGKVNDLQIICSPSMLNSIKEEQEHSVMGEEEEQQQQQQQEEEESSVVDVADEIKNEELEEDLITEEPQAKKDSTAKKRPILTIVTGTHIPTDGKLFLDVDERTQPEICLKLSDALHALFTAWDVKTYMRSKTKVKVLLSALAGSAASTACTLAGSRSNQMLWTFPITNRPDSGGCDAKTKNTLLKKSYLKEKTKVYVNWFLLRPDLVTLHNMASVVGVEMRILAIVGHDSKFAAFTKEGCARFNTILDKRDVYQQRLLLVALSDLQHQLDRLKSTTKKVFVCSRNELPRGSDDSLEEWGIVSHPSCEARPKLHASKTHLGSATLLGLFNKNHFVPKKIFTGPRLVFVAGLEGVGHHVFSLLGRKHTTRMLYDALTDHLCDSAWNDNSEQLYSAARERLAEAMKTIRTDVGNKDGSKVFFLNTVWTQRDVNMYSFPWGGPRCFLKRYARVMCNIDLIELARIAQESAGVDFRVVLLTRSIGAAVVSASLHRPFGTLVSETRMLAESWSLLKSSVDSLDPKFTIQITYEDLMNHPEASTAKLAEHFGIDKENALYSHMLNTLRDSAIEHPVGDGSKWKEEVDMEMMQFMSDILGL